MRMASIGRRAHLVGQQRVLDIERASGGAFSHDPQHLFARWSEVATWADAVDPDTRDDATPIEAVALDNPVGTPREVFAIGLNYAAHAAESQLDAPTQPVVFTKFVSSLTGPDADVEISGDSVDWEAELVVVMGTGGRGIPASQAWEHVAGLTVGQDLSDRTIQWWAPPAQFSLGKSLAGFAPVGPWVVTRDEFLPDHDLDDLGIECTLIDVDGTRQLLQSGRTSEMIFSVPTLIEKLSAAVELLPEDIIFTGTPAGVGMGRTPPVYLVPGQSLETTIEGLGTIVQRFTRGT